MAKASKQPDEQANYRQTDRQAGSQAVEERNANKRCPRGLPIGGGVVWSFRSCMVEERNATFVAPSQVWSDPTARIGQNVVRSLGSGC